MSGIHDTTIIDMDRVSLTNLNRQFLFQPKDIGRPKATVCAERLSQQRSIRIITNEQLDETSTVPIVRPIFGRIEEYHPDWYSQFHLIISGLDSIEARRWINKVLHQCSQRVPLLDGGTEGLKGHVRKIIPGLTACFECTLDLFAPGGSRPVYPLCTLAGIPRLPEHCVEWAVLIEWSRKWQVTFDPDNQEHFEWIFQTALQRASEYGIAGLTRQLARGILGNIVPAVASTNAIIGGMLVQEALRMLQDVDQSNENFVFWNGSEGIYTVGIECQPNPDCLICKKK